MLPVCVNKCIYIPFIFIGCALPWPRAGPSSPACISYPLVWHDLYILHRGLYFQPRLGTAGVVEECDHVPAIPVYRS